MILFSNIFERAVNLFDDPDISDAYYNDLVSFDKMMLPHLINGKNYFTNPTVISYRLSSYSESEGSLEIIDGTGVDAYVLTTIPVDGADFTCKIAGVIDQLASYDTTTNTVTFSQVVPVGTSCSVEWFYAGAFTNSFTNMFASSINTGAIMERVTDALAHCLCLAWAQKNRNFLLEIRNLLTDTDFKLYSPANSLKAKNDWVKQLQSELNELMTKLCWDIKSTQRGGNTFGQ